MNEEQNPIQGGEWEEKPGNLPEFIYLEFGPETIVYLFHGPPAKGEKREIETCNLSAGFSFCKRQRYTFKTTLKEAADAAENLGYFICEGAALELRD